MSDTTWHPYSERRPTALERAAERYRIACVAERAAGAAFDADAAGGGESWVLAWRETVDAREALLSVARGDL